MSTTRTLASTPNAGHGANTPAHPITTYAEFWPYYLREHAKPATRAWHYAATVVSLVALLGLLTSGNPVWLAVALFGSYGLAWVSHFFIEKNQPATFRYPLWSLASDYRMFFAWIGGKLPAELRRAGVRD